MKAEPKLIKLLLSLIFSLLQYSFLVMIIKDLCIFKEGSPSK
jgi:hypothetical protein